LLAGFFDSIPQKGQLHMSVSLMRRLRAPAVFVLLLLVIEWLDEFIYGMREAAWPLIRNDLNLDYTQIGILLGLPNLLAVFIETGMGILADMGKRRMLILGGGVVFAIASFLTALSGNFLLLLISFIIFYPASGAFVGLAQATLMDIDTSRHEQNMARWTFAGSVGVLTGSLALGFVSTFGLGWRELFFVSGIITIVLWAVMRRMAFPKEQADDEEPMSFREGLRSAFKTMKKFEVMRWFVLLEFSDFLLDVLHGYMALYFVDIVGVDELQAGIAVTVWTGIGLIGDFLLIPLLERVRGLDYLRYSALAELILYPMFLLIPGFVPKVIVLALLGFCNAGWYSVLQAQVYTAMPGQSGAVMTISNVIGLTKPLIPVVIGFVATQYDLQVALWLLLIAPIALLVGIPRNVKQTVVEVN
jgi:FSR family fosmidomycin resistance protein-like MFS transporter